jgi:hypothetical protein
MILKKMLFECMLLFVPCEHIMVRKCLLLSQKNNKCKNCIKMKNVNVQLSFLIRDIWAGDKGVSARKDH